MCRPGDMEETEELLYFQTNFLVLRRCDQFTIRTFQLPLNSILFLTTEFILENLSLITELSRMSKLVIFDISTQ